MKWGGGKVISNLNSKNVLTLSDVLPCPLVILEERMPLDLIYTITAKSNFPVGVREDISHDHFNSYACDCQYTSRSSSISLVQYLYAMKHIYVIVYVYVN